MITKQLDVDYVNDDTLAINLWLANRWIITTCLPSLHRTMATNWFTWTFFPNLDNIATNSINFLIDFLPHFEYVLYQIVQLIAPNNPTSILPINYQPTNIVIFQASPHHANSDMPGLSTKAADPTP
jgi:hypothetical protein